MLKFNEYFAESFPRGKGTGTKRRQNWDKFIKDQNWGGVPTKPWEDCEHNCSKHGHWFHKIETSIPCHLPPNHDCESCLYFDDPKVKGMTHSNHKK